MKMLLQYSIVKLSSAYLWHIKYMGIIGFGETTSWSLTKVLFTRKETKTIGFIIIVT
jgi:hypothetical protein